MLQPFAASDVVSIRVLYFSAMGSILALFSVIAEINDDIIATQFVFSNRSHVRCLCHFDIIVLEYFRFSGTLIFCITGLGGPHFVPPFLSLRGAPVLRRGVRGCGGSARPVDVFFHHSHVAMNLNLSRWAIEALLWRFITSGLLLLV